MKNWSVILLSLLGSTGFTQTANIKEKPAARVVRYAQEAAADPVTPASSEKRAAAMQLVEDDHEIHVLLCQNIFNQIRANSSRNAHEITLQYLISAAAFLYGHPEASSDMNAQNVAGLEAAAKVYQSFLQTEPKTHAKFLDTVVKQRADGTLKEFVTKTCK